MTVMTVSTQMPVSALCRTIKALLVKGDQATEKAEQFYISAGKYLVELKERCPGTWESIAKEKIGIGRSRAYEYLALADGRRSLAQIQHQTNERTKKAREINVRPLRSGQTNIVPFSPQEPDEESSIEEDISPRNLMNAFLLRADQALQFAVYSGKITKETLAAAKRTAAAWNDLVQQMENEL